MEKHFDDQCRELREVILGVAQNVKALKGHPDFVTKPEQADLGEMAANVMLAYRHLEDARMRLGKAIQAFEGRESCYPG